MSIQKTVKVDAKYDGIKEMRLIIANNGEIFYLAERNDGYTGLHTTKARKDGPSEANAIAYYDSKSEALHSI